MSKKTPALALGVLVGLLVLSTLAVPPPGPRPDNSAVVTADVKGLEASLSKLKGHVEAGRVEDARSELSRLEKQWLALKPGLRLRNLQGVPSDAFDAALANMKATRLEDRNAAVQAQRTLASSFARVKTDLQGSATVDLGRLAVAVLAFLAALVALVVAIPRVSDRLRLAQ